MPLKKSQKSLKSWTKQKWRTSDGKPSKGKKRYLPAAAWAALTPAQKAATNKAKAKGNKKGKQFVKQPKKIAEKTAKFRAAEGGLAMKKGYHKMPDGSMMKDSDHKSGYMGGGMAKKKPTVSGYKHGGVVKANCGASMQATQGKKK